MLIIIDILRRPAAQQRFDDIGRPVKQGGIDSIGRERLAQSAVPGADAGQILVHDAVLAALAQQPVPDFLACRLQPLHQVDFSPAMNLLSQLKKNLVAVLHPILDRHRGI
ncbi:hypothetical protein D1872_285940 [compost metagenome]